VLQQQRPSCRRAAIDKCVADWTVEPESSLQRLNPEIEDWAGESTLRSFHGGMGLMAQNSVQLP